MLSDEALSEIEERARRANQVHVDGNYAELGVIASVVREDVPALVAEAKSLRAENGRLLDTLHLDHTGLAKALEEVVFEARSRMWIVDGRGSYEWDDERYQREAGWALEAIIKRALGALRASGDLAHAHCCGRKPNVARKVQRLRRRAK